MSSFERLQQPKQETIALPPDNSREREERCRTEHCVSLSDIHNDLVAAQASLEQRGIVSKDGAWRHPMDLIITGDSVNKQAPNLEVLRYFRHLQKTAPPGYSVKMLAGNHELDLLSRAADGEKIELKDKMIDFLGSMDIVCVRGPVLYLHRYPSIGLVRDMWQQYCKQDGNPDRWDINRRFQEAVSTIHKTPAQSKAVFLECDDGGDERSLGGLSAQAYYQRYGVIIGHFLKEMGITTVIHGHKKRKEGGQGFEQYIPGIFMVNNDACISSDKNPEHHHRIGSLQVIPTKDGGIEVTCTYKPDTKSGRKGTQVQQATIH